MRRIAACVAVLAAIIFGISIASEREPSNEEVLFLLFTQ